MIRLRKQLHHISGEHESAGAYGRIASLKQVVIEFADAAGARFPFLPHIGLEVHDAFLLRLRFFLRLHLADAPVDAGGGCALHIAGDVGVDVQRCHRRHMAQHGGEGFHIHAVFQRQRCEGVPQIMESDTLAVCPLQYRLKPPARHAGRDRSVRLHRGRKHPAGIHLPAVFPQHGQHRRRQHQFSHGRLGFGRDDLQFAVYRVRLFVDGQHAGFKVQVVPLKRYQFAPPQTGAEIQQEQLVVPVRLRLNEKFLQFLPIQHPHLLCLFRRQLTADGGVCTEQVIPHGPFQGGAADRVAHPHHAVGKARAVLLRQTLATVLFQPPVELLQIILRQFVQRDFPDLRQDMVVNDVFVVVLCGGAERRLAVVFVPVAQPVPEQHIRLNFSVISPHHAFGELM